MDFAIDMLDRASYTVADGDGQRRRYAKQASMWMATNDLARSAPPPFYTRLNQILDTHDFDEYFEGSASDSTRTTAGQGCRPRGTSGSC